MTTRGFSIHPPILPVCLVVLFAAGSASAQTSSPGRNVDAVYTFAWVNAAVGGMGVRF